MAWIVHDADGRITQTVEGEVDETFPERVAALGGTAAQVPLQDIFDRRVHEIYFRDGEVVRRPIIDAAPSKLQISADGVDTSVIDGLPRPCEVVVNGEAYTIDDGRLDLTSDMPADYEIRIDHWPFMPWSATVAAR